MQATVSEKERCSRWREWHERREEHRKRQPVWRGLGSSGRFGAVLWCWGHHCIPTRTSWAGKQPPSLFITVFCAMILQGVGDTLPFYTAGKEFQAIPQRGQDPWPPEVQSWGNIHSLCSLDQRHPWSSLGSGEPPSVAAAQHWARAPWCTASRGLCGRVSPPRVKKRGPTPRKPLKAARNILLELKARTKEVQPASGFHLHSWNIYY